MSLVHRKARGDILLQDVIFTPEAIQRGLDIMANEYGVGELAYTPEMRERYLEVLERRFGTSDGPDQFQMPNYGVYEDPEMAAYYGANTALGNDIQTQVESLEEEVDRLLRESARETAYEAPGLMQQMTWYALESAPRHGVADEAPFAHVDPNITLFRNPSRGWAAIDNPIATSDKTNIIDMTSVIPDYTFPKQHPAWLVDKDAGLYSSLPSDFGPAGF